jgi:nucleoside phosphorylase
MKYRVNLSWKVLLRPMPSIEERESTSDIFFRELGGNGFVRALGGDFRVDAPVVLAPTDLFHNALKPVSDLLGGVGRRFPYAFFWRQLGLEAKVHIAIHRHNGILCATVRLESFEITAPVDWVEIQDLSKNEFLWRLTCKALAIAAFNDRKRDLPILPQVVRAIHIRSIQKDSSNWEADLVGVVTGHNGANDAILEAVLSKNKPHQVDKSRILIDKQGLASYVPSFLDERSALGNFDRFENARAMLQLACVIRMKLQTSGNVSEDEKKAILDPGNAVPASVSGQLMWNLFAQDFKLASSFAAQMTKDENKRDLQKMTAPDDRDPAISGINRYSLLLVTVTKIESVALRRELKDVIGREPSPKKIDGFTYQTYGRIGDFDITHQISGMGTGGLVGSQESIRRSIAAIKADGVLMVGIAFGVDRKKQPIGTVLASKQLVPYELQRVNKKSVTPRGDVVSASPRLLNYLSHAEATWMSDKFDIKSGLMLSGEKLIDNIDYRLSLQGIAPEAIGGEMEGAGLYVSSQLANVDWLLIKAVCDWADGNKGKDKDNNQRIAAESAAKFVMHLLKVNSEMPI